MPSYVGERGRSTSPRLSEMTRIAAERRKPDLLPPFKGPADAPRPPDSAKPRGEGFNEIGRKDAFVSTSRAHIDPIPVAEARRDLRAARAPVREVIGDEDPIDLRVMHDVRGVWGPVLQAVVGVFLLPCAAGIAMVNVVTVGL